jgi:hypothetical protein
MRLQNFSHMSLTSQEGIGGHRHHITIEQVKKSVRCFAYEGIFLVQGSRKSNEEPVRADCSVYLSTLYVRQRHFSASDSNTN